MLAKSSASTACTCFMSSTRKTRTVTAWRPFVYCSPGILDGKRVPSNRSGPGALRLVQQVRDFLQLLGGLLDLPLQHLVLVEGPGHVALLHVRRQLAFERAVGETEFRAGDFQVALDPVGLGLRALEGGLGRHLTHDDPFFECAPKVRSHAKAQPSSIRPRNRRNSAHAVRDEARPAVGPARAQLPSFSYMALRRGSRR